MSLAFVIINSILSLFIHVFWFKLKSKDFNGHKFKNKTKIVRDTNFSQNFLLWLKWVAQTATPGSHSFLSHPSKTEPEYFCRHVTFNCIF